MRGFFPGGPPRRGYHHGNLKSALVEAARRLISERGPLGFTLAEAARLAGVTSAAPYRHFKDRSALLAELARQGFELFAQRLGAAWRTTSDPAEAFQRMGEAYLAFAAEEPGLYDAMFLARPAAGEGEASPFAMNLAPPDDPPPLQEAADGSFEQLVAGLERAYGPALAGIDVRTVALRVWAYAHGIAMLARAGRLPRGRHDPTPQELLRSGVAAIVEGARAAARAAEPPRR